MIHPLTINDAAILIVGFIGLLAGAVAALTALVNKTRLLVQAVAKLHREFKARIPKAPRHVRNPRKARQHPTLGIQNVQTKVHASIGNPGLPSVGNSHLRRKPRPHSPRTRVPGDLPTDKPNCSHV